MELKKEKWTKQDYKEFVKYLKQIGNEDYIVFTKKIVKENVHILGIKIPKLKAIAKEIVKGEYHSFLHVCENNYQEELLIEGLVIGYIKKKEDFDLYLDSFVYKINNWAVCDTTVANMKIIKKYQEEYLSQILDYAKSNEEFVVRFALVCLLAHYKEEKYIETILKTINEIKIDTYYVNMAKAWLLCELYIHHKEKINLKKLDVNVFVFNKFISKCCDSYRLTKEEKAYLKKQKRIEKILK